MPSRSVNPDILFNTIKEDQENGTSKASEMLKQAFPGVGNSCDDLASLFGQALMQDDSDKVSLVVTAPPSFSINARTKMMYEAGLISDYKAQYAGNSLYSFGVSNLTWEGYEYLDKIRDDSIWKKVKDVAKDKGLPLAIDTVKQIASVIISSMTEGAIKAVTGV